MTSSTPTTCHHCGKVIDIGDQFMDDQQRDVCGTCHANPPAPSAPRYWVIRAHIKNSRRSATTTPYYSGGLGTWYADGLKAERYATEAAAENFVRLACWAERNRGEAVEVVPVH